MNSAPLISIVLPTYNGTGYLTQSIQSCLDQTHQNLELIIVDDCSTDQTPRIIRGYDDPRVVSLRHDQNRGLPHALNTGFRHARGDYLTWTSDDNWFRDGAIQRLLQVLYENPDVGMVYSDYWEVDRQGNTIDLCRVGEPEEILTVPLNQIGPSFLYRREVYETIGDYDPKWRLVEDYDFWLRIAGRFQLLAVHEPLYSYRSHEATLTSSNSRYVVHRKVLKLALQRGVLSKTGYAQWLGDSRVDAAFFYHSRHQRRATITNLLTGMMLRPSHARNLGAWSILLESIVGDKLAHSLRRACSPLIR